MSGPSVITSDCAALDRLRASLDLSPLLGLTLPGQDRIDAFLASGAAPTVVSLAADRIVLLIDGFELVVTGSGFEPVTDAAGFLAAFTDGSLSGTVDTVSLGEGATPLVLITAGATSYTLQAGNVSVSLTGTLPTELNQVLAFWQALPAVLSQGSALSADDQALFTAILTPYVLDGLTVTIGGTPVAVLSNSAAGTTLEIGGFTLSFDAPLFETAGDLASLILEADALGGLSFATLVQLIELTEITIAETGGATLLTITGSPAIINAFTYTIDGGSFDVAVLLEIGIGGTGAVFLDQASEQSTFVLGTALDDEIRSGSGNDLLCGLDGDDTLKGGAGNDTIKGGNGADFIGGGDGFDLIAAGDGDDHVAGGNGRDTVFLGRGNDQYNDNSQGGELGQDTVFAGHGDDVIEGGGGNDVFYGEWGNDLIFARLGDDIVYGGDQFDTIHAGEGNDTVWGGNGRDLIFLDEGNDLFIDNAQGGELGRDTVYAGAGDDTIEGGNGDDVFFGGTGNDAIYARLGDDTVYGGDSFDFIDAGDGNDLVYGGNGRDRILLGAGNDIYVDTHQAGELGQDTITGGAGEDVFVFGSLISEDVITDFEIGVDTLELTLDLVGGRDSDQVVFELASVTADGVLIAIGTGQSILLQGLTSTLGLEDDISIL